MFVCAMRVFVHGMWDTVLFVQCEHDIRAMRARVVRDENTLKFIPSPIIYQESNDGDLIDARLRSRMMAVYQATKRKIWVDVWARVKDFSPELMSILSGFLFPQQRFGDIYLATITFPVCQWADGTSSSQ